MAKTKKVAPKRIRAKTKWHVTEQDGKVIADVKEVVDNAVKRMAEEVKAKESNAVAPPTPTWLSHEHLTEPGLYVMKNNEGIRAIRMVFSNDGLSTSIFGKYVETALSSIGVHIDVLRHSIFQKIKE